MSDVPSEPEPQPRGERPWWKKKRWAIPLLILVVPMVLSGVAGVVQAASGGVPEDDHEKVVSERDAAQRRIDTLESKLESTEEALERAEEAQEEAERELAEKEEALDERATQLDEREAGIQQAEEAAEKSSFGDGTHEVGVDVVPGRYHADAGSRTCYWAKLTNDAEREIMDNSLSSGRQVVTLEEGVLVESDGCGTWQRRE